jgi:hypothetical protein
MAAMNCWWNLQLKAGWSINMSVENMLIAAEAQARQVILEKQGELPPTWVLVDAQGQVEVEMTPWRDVFEKYMAEIFIRAKIKKHNVVAYSFLVEAWMANAPKGWEPGKDPPIRASQRPERKECVVACAVTKEKKHWAFWEIKRDPQGKAIALEPQHEHEKGAGAGWMSELLDPPKK